MSAIEKQSNVTSGAVLARALDRTAVIIPVYNGASHWESLNAALKRQGIRSDQILIVDSSSTDDSGTLARQSGYQVKKIPLESFRHGATRQMAAEILPWADFLVYLTQDAIPLGDRSIETLVESFSDRDVGAAYGRQMPRSDADLIECHARLFNYPSTTVIRTYDSRKKLGFRAAFFSNSFAAYRRSALELVGGFPKHTIVSEDVTVAALMLMAGWKTVYQADAAVTHSHRLSMREEFSRYFDIGVHHGREKWLIEQFGGARGEGLAFVWSEFSFLFRTKRRLIPIAAMRNLNKWLSYHLGIHEKYLSLGIKKAMSGQRGFWRDERTADFLMGEAAQSGVGREWRIAGGSPNGESTDPKI